MTHFSAVSSLAKTGNDMTFDLILRIISVIWLLPVQSCISFNISSIYNSILVPVSYLGLQVLSLQDLEDYKNIISGLFLFLVLFFF